MVVVSEGAPTSAGLNGVPPLAVVITSLALSLATKLSPPEPAIRVSIWVAASLVSVVIAVASYLKPPLKRRLVPPTWTSVHTRSLTAFFNVSAMVWHVTESTAFSVAASSARVKVTSIFTVLSTLGAAAGMQSQQSAVLVSNTCPVGHAGQELQSVVALHEAF